MGYEDKHFRPMFRLILLRLLAGAMRYTLNDEILKDYCAPESFHVSRDQIRGELAWLAEQGLVTVEELEKFHVATITERGQEVADGIVHVPGVKRPAPGRG